MVFGYLGDTGCERTLCRDSSLVCPGRPINAVPSLSFICTGWTSSTTPPMNALCQRLITRPSCFFFRDSETFCVQLYFCLCAPLVPPHTVSSPHTEQNIDPWWCSSVEERWLSKPVCAFPKNRVLGFSPFDDYGLARCLQQDSRLGLTRRRSKAMTV